MKKFLTVLLTAAMIASFPANIFAEEAQNQELKEDVTTGNIALVASKASTYYVKLPTKVDVSSGSATINIYAKGDVDAAKMIVVKAATGDHYLKDDAKDKSDVKLTVTDAQGIKGADINSANYNTEKGSSMTVTHNGILAGSWSGTLPIVISLENIAQ